MKISYNHSLVSENEITQIGEQLREYIDLLNRVVEGNTYEAYESSINLPSDTTLTEKSIAATKEIDISKVRYILDIGIGGSNLGTKAIYDSMYGYFDIIEPDRYPKMIFLDTVNNEQLQRTIQFLKNKIQSPEEVLIVFISKSGGTTETIANLELLHTYTPHIFDASLKNVVAITDENSPLWNKATEKGIKALPIPKPVGGRYSVFSPVGIFPLAALGFNIEALLGGAQDMRSEALSQNYLENPAIISAAIQYIQLQKGKTIHDTFIFQSNFESIGKWYRQLMGESIGKEFDLNNNKVNTGINPNLSIGSTDLHSVGQLYLGGPRDKMTEFVYASKTTEPLTLPGEIFMDGLVAHIASKTTTNIMDAILQGVMLAYEKKELPFITVDLEEISLHSIGEFMQFKMIEMMYLGKLLNVNTFDQPNVESYKIETKKILSEG